MTRFLLYRDVYSYAKMKMKMWQIGEQQIGMNLKINNNNIFS